MTARIDEICSPASQLRGKGGWAQAIGLLVGQMALALSCAAADYPVKPVKLVIPFGPGSASDIIVRRMAPKMTENLGQPVVIENRPGGGGNIAAEAVLSSPPDGYTVFMGSTASHAASPHLQASISYEPFKAFVPVAKMASYSFALVTSASLNLKTVSDLLAYAKASKAPVSYASAGVGSSAHVFGLAFENATGLQLTHVPYTSPAAALVDLSTGRVTFMFYVFNALQPLILAGKLSVLATTGPKREVYLPDAPTMLEAGIPNFIWTSWFGMFAPANTPRAVVARLSEAVAAAGNDPGVARELAAGGVDTTPSTPAELDSLSRSEFERYRKLFQAAGIKPQ